MISFGSCYFRRFDGRPRFFARFRAEDDDDDELPIFPDSFSFFWCPELPFRTSPFPVASADPPDIDVLQSDIATMSNDLKKGLHHVVVGNTQPCCVLIWKIKVKRTKMIYLTNGTRSAVLRLHLIEPILLGSKVVAWNLSEAAIRFQAYDCLLSH